VQTLQAFTSETPVALSSDEEACLARKFPGGLEVFRRLDPVQQRGVLLLVEDCVSLRRGLPYTPHALQHHAPSGVISAAFEPSPFAAGAGYVRSGNLGVSRGGQLQIENVWLEDMPWGRISVGAGLRQTYPTAGGPPVSIGIVVVMVNVLSENGISPPPNLQRDGDYPTPSDHRSVHIVDAIGETLKLQAADGTIFYFDVASRQYVAGFPAATPATGP